VRERGFEPRPLAGLDPKSSASANSATLASYSLQTTCVNAITYYTYHWMGVLSLILSLERSMLVVDLNSNHDPGGSNHETPTTLL
jgi:hypothetical protein